MNKFFLLFFIFSLLPLAAEEKEYFRSNAIGMFLETIAWYRVDEYEYILERTWLKGSEIRRLLKKKVELKRWELSYFPDKSIREEKEFRETHLYKISSYQPGRSLAEERFFQDGELYRQTKYTYAARNRLSQVITYTGNGELLYTDTYSLSAEGGLRETQRHWEDLSFQKTTLIRSSGNLVQETHASDKETIINHFDSRGNLTAREIWKRDILTESITYTFQPESTLLQTVLTENFSTGITTNSSYNSKGQLLQDLITKGKAQLAVIDYIYAENGTLKETREKNTAEGLKLIKYFYSAAGVLAYEEQFLRGTLSTKIQYLSGDEYYREHYNRQGQAVIRIYFKDDVKYKEETLEAGKVVQTRMFE